MTTPQRGARSPGVVFVVLASALVVLMATAFAPSQPPPPPSAEFAPAAQRPLREAPPDQTSQEGLDKGRGGHGPGAHASPTPTSTTPAPTSSTVHAPPTSFRCIGDPPRQTEDPQSPPCVTTVVKDNGGATTAGVDANTIRISVPNNPDDRQLQAFVSYFNQTFNFYGRQLKVVPGDGCFGGGTPQEMRGLADSIAQQQVFAVLGYCDAKGTEYPFFDQLAAHKVVSVANRPSIETEGHYAAHHPYEWTYWAPFDLGITHIADVVCSLAGKQARYGGSGVQQQARKFGLFYNTFTDAPSPDLRAFDQAVSACGATITDRAALPIDRNGGAAGQGYSADTAQRVSAALLRMRQDGVTTIIHIQHPDTAKQVFQVASSQGYEPEHLVSSWLYNDSPEASYPADQARHVLAVSAYNRLIHPAEEYWYQAIKQGDPGYPFSLGKFNYYNAFYVYWPMLVLAAGIQMAGPHLTPATFAKGLQTTTYPNAVVPGHVEGKVTISAGQHSYLADASLMWMSPGTSDPDYGTAAAWCYVGAGRRFQVGRYPRDIPFQQPPCGRYG